MRGLFLLGLAAVFAAACATSVDTEESFLGEGGAFTGVGGSGGDDAASTSHATSSSSAGGMGGDGGSPPDCVYDATNTCQTGQSLGTVAGDSGGSPMVVSGTTSKWFVVYIEEQDSSIFETDMSYTVTLVSPPGMDFNLVVHQGPQDGQPDCNAPAQLGMGAGTETVHNSWDDDQGLGGEDDSLYLNILVQYAAGDLCDVSWTLTVQGNT